MPSRIPSILTGVALAAVTALPAAAGATSFKPETRAFEVTVSGVQTDAYRYSHHKVFVCDVDGHGSGTEVLRFASRKPELIDANRFGPNLVVFGNGHAADDDVMMNAKLTRRRSEWHGTLPANCGGNGGGGKVTPSDCGTKYPRFDLMVGWKPTGRRGITLDTGFFPPVEVFHNCTVNGIHYPEILTSQKRSQIVGSISVASLFSPSGLARKTTGAGRYVFRDSTGWQETTIRWTITLRPVHEVKGGNRQTPDSRAGAARSTAVSYRGRTRADDPISFTVNGSKVSKLKAYVPTVCLPTHGTPMSGTDPFDPPGSFRLGHTDSTHAKRKNAMYPGADPTKHFVVSTQRDRTGRVSGKLHVDYSYLMILPTWPPSATPYVCTGDTTFRLSPHR